MTCKPRDIVNCGNSVDKCSQPAKEEGTCDDYVLRYSYVSSSGQCEPFYYGGCEGNDNRFESPEECQAQCIRSEAATTRRPPRETERPDVDDLGSFMLMHTYMCI